MYKLKYGNNAHLALTFAKVNNGTVTVPYLMFMNAKKFPKARAGNTRQMLVALERYGLLERELGEFDTWTLTSLGREAIKHSLSKTLVFKGAHV